MHLMTGLNPRLNLVMNGALFFLWALGFSMLSYWAWGTMSHDCSVANWRDSVGVMVCQIYKALFSFSLLGLCVPLSCPLFHATPLTRPLQHRYHLRPSS